MTVGRKITLHGEGHRFFVATSGLRSVRDKTRAYLDRDLNKREGHNFPTMLNAVEGFVTHMRAVARSDQEYFEDPNLWFNLHAFIHGKLEKTTSLIHLPGASGRQLDRGRRAESLLHDR